MKDDFRVSVDEKHININEILYYIKKKSNYIVITTITSAIIATIFSFFIAKPVYQYNAFIRFPNNIGASQINSFKETIKDDIKPLDQLEDKENRIVSAIVPKGTQLIKLTFEGNSVNNVKLFGDKYVRERLKEINQIIVEKEKQKYNKEIISYIKSDIHYISSKLNEYNFSIQDAKNRLLYLTEMVEEKEKNQLFLKAELAKDIYIPEKPIRPKKINNIIVSAMMGAFLSFMYLVIKFLLNR